MADDWMRKLRRNLSNSKKSYATNKVKYITAYDPTIRRRVVFIVRNGTATSLVTGYSFWYGY